MSLRIFTLCFIFNAVVQQTFCKELNIGISGGPVMGMPFMGKNSTRSKLLGTQLFNLNAQVGLTLNMSIKDFCIETGAYAGTRSVVFKMDVNNLAYNNIGSGNTSVSANSKVRAIGYSYSAPLVVGYILHKHNAQTVYNVYGLLGASYEMYTSAGYSYSSASVSSGNNAGSITNVTEVYPAGGEQARWVNIIAGFKINAILRHVGLVEYGLRYNYPLADAGRHSLRSVISNGVYGSVFAGDFYPCLARFDIQLTYFFFNLESGRRKKYRYN